MPPAIIPEEALFLDAAILASTTSELMENTSFEKEETLLLEKDVANLDTIFEADTTIETNAESTQSQEVLSDQGLEVVAEQIEEAIISTQEEHQQGEETPTGEQAKIRETKEVLEGIPSLKQEEQEIEKTKNMDEITKAMEFLEAGRLKAAGKLFKKAVEKYPKNVQAHYQYANYLNDLAGKPQKATKYYKKTLKLQANHPFANYDLALIYYNQGDRFRAHRAYQKAAKINPELNTEQNNLAFKYVPQALKEKTNIIDKAKIESLQEDIQRLEQLLVAKQIASDEEQIAEQTKTTAATPLGKVVLITGATSGIGKATAEVFAKNGHRVILTGRRIERLKILKAGFESKFNTNVQILPFDVRDTPSVKAAFESLDEDWKQIDILINNAGLGKGYADIHKGNIEHWDTMIDTNIKGLLYMTRAITPYMVKRKEGHIINVGSTVGRDVYRKGNVYCATKAAVDALTKAMRLDLYEYNIRVSQVSPAHTEDTEFALVRHEDEEKAKIYDDFQPLKASDVAETIYFMASRPAYVNILDVVLQGTQQPSASLINRSGR